jgi:hypothetical protein
MDTLLANSSIGKLLTLVTLPVLVVTIMIVVGVLTGLAGRIALMCEDIAYRIRSGNGSSAAERSL